jgi:hypothetical protein
MDCCGQGTPSRRDTGRGARRCDARRRGEGRQISPDDERAIAETGCSVGIWHATGSSIC